MGRLGPLNTTAFIAAIKTMGKVPTQWLRYEGECPRCQEAGGAFSPSLPCTLCGGTGALFTDQALPTHGLTAGKMLFAQALVGKTYAPIQLLDGDLMASYVEDDYAIGERDRFTLSTRDHRFQERKTRGSGAADRLRHVPVTSIQSAWDSSGARAVTDYAVSGDGLSVTWSNGPAAGSQYAITYWFRPVYQVVTGSIHHREEADDGSKFPTRAVLRLWQQAGPDVQEGLL